jgi:magnesium chelatase family protein
MDRIDLHIPVRRVPFKELGATDGPSESRTIRLRVQEARAIQEKRFRKTAEGTEGTREGREGEIYCNGQMGPREIREYCTASSDVARLLQRALDRLGLSARAYHRILKVARTVADLDGSHEIGTAHISEAIQYRSMDRSSPL